MQNKESGSSLFNVCKEDGIQVSDGSVNPVDCSHVGMYSGIALKRDNAFYSKTEILYSAHPPILRWWNSMQTILLD